MNELLSEVQKALDEAITYVLNYADKHNLDPARLKAKFRIRYWKPHREDPHQATLVTEERTRPSFQTFYRAAADDMTTAEPIVLLNSLCAEFRSKHRVAMEKYYPESTYGIDMLSLYFDELGQFVHNPQVASKIVDEFQSDITASTENIELVYYVEDFNADQPFTLLGDKISFAPVSDHDLVKNAKFPESGFSAPFYLNPSKWICRILVEGSKTGFDDFNNADDLLNHVLNALFLVTEGNARFRLLYKEIANPFLKLGRVSGGETINSGIVGAVEVTGSKVAKLDDVLRKVRDIAARDDLNLLRLPLRRMRDSASRRSTEDALLDTVFALERLLAHDSPALETTYRFRLRGAALLDEEFGSPRERISNLSAVYNIRSKVAHGSKYKSAELPQRLDYATRALKAIFLKYLDYSDKINPQEIVERVDETMVEQIRLEEPSS